MTRLLPALLFLSSVAMAQPDATEADRIDAAIARLVKPARRHRLNNAEARSTMTADILAAAAGHPDVPPWTLLGVAFLESSLDPDARGNLGEIGVMQIHGVAAAGCDLRTQRGQLECGAALLQSGVEQCGSMRGSLVRYATGACKTKSERVRNLVNYRLRFIQKLEGK